jgi:hypothetical protein
MSFHTVQELLDERRRELAREADRERLAAQAARAAGKRWSVIRLLRRASRALRKGSKISPYLRDIDLDSNRIPRVRDYPMAPRN